MKIPSSAYTVMDHHQGVIANLDKKLKKGEITKEEYAARVEEQEARTAAKLKEIKDGVEADTLELMKAGG